MVININKFDKQVENIKNDMKNYESNIYEALTVINNMSHYWNDNYTKSFFKKINQLNQNVNELIDCMHSFIVYLKTISSDYHYVNSKKRNLFGQISPIIDSGAYVINSSDDEDTSNKKKELSNSITDAEYQIGSMIFKLIVPYVEKLYFDNLDEERSDNLNEFVGMINNMPIEIKKYEQKKHDVSASSDRLKDSLSTIISLYDSKNSRRLTQIINEINEALYIINSNLNRAYEYIIARKAKYEKLFSEITDDASKIWKFIFNNSIAYK